MNDLPETAASATVDATRAIVADVVETAQAEIDRAQETAEHLARAALETELGQRVNAHEGAISECRNLIVSETNRLETLISDRINQAVEALGIVNGEAASQLREALAALSMRMEAAELLATPGSGPPILQGRPTPVVIVDPTLATPIPEPGPAAPEVKRRRRFA